MNQEMSPRPTQYWAIFWHFRQQRSPKPKTQIMHLVTLDELYRTVYLYWQHRYPINDESRNVEPTIWASYLIKDMFSEDTNEAPEKIHNILCSTQFSTLWGLREKPYIQFYKAQRTLSFVIWLLFNSLEILKKKVEIIWKSKKLHF